ncbi:MAG: alpha,alpha-trehalose-phosphate synthase (UDP-forming) [Halanaerobiaceae bacterium]
MDTEFELDGRLILVSNGEPYAHNYDENGKINCEKLPGGLTTGLDPLMQKEKGVWIAWGRGEADFEVVDEKNRVKVPDEDGYTLKRIKLTPADQDGFYYGFSNEVMWPICHSFIAKANYNKDYWYTYLDVNKQYAEAVLSGYKEGDLIWVHDYQLTLVPGFIKKQAPGAKVSMFWHIPWPSWEAFRTLPWREELLNQMLKADFLAFHIPLFVKNFLNCAEKIGAKVNRENKIVEYNGEETAVTSIPLGIDYSGFHRVAKSLDMDTRAREIKNYYNAEKLIFGVDRLDYTKGILERLKAIDLLFEEYPRYLGKVTMVQRISPSRTQVEEYQEMREEINRTIAAINGKYQKDDWAPIKNFNRAVPQEELIPYYRAADIGLITPLIDGMNLVAKEYVAAQEDGVLILSEFAGASSVLDEALTVNPYHIEKVADTLHRALQMSEEERRRRMKYLKQKVHDYDINWWRDIFLKKWVELYD